MWNRYFMPLCEAKGMQAIPFLPGVDLSGILYNMAHEDNNYWYIHSEDNQVQYFTLHRDDKGITKYERCDPHMFRAGDLIEVQLSFIVIPVKGGHYKMLAILCLLALTKGTNFKKTELQPYMSESPMPKVTSIKQRSGYANETNTEQKRQRTDYMRIDSESLD
ncbi:hypothetical protein BGW80DRAFT_1256362 [Lactifluus volemus]|nr:hypothetical protein BGW80DRAFT_1256362 [Lactifluus volemus]